MTCAGPSRRGVTRLEAIVMLVVAAVSVGLMLPVVDAVREASRQRRCQRNQQAVGEAILGHASAHGRFPTGVGCVAADRGCPLDTGRFVWTFTILPRLGHDDVAALIRPETLGMLPTSPDPFRALTKTIPVYRCPSDTHVLVDHELTETVEFTQSNYVGCFSPHGFPIEPEADVPCLINQHLHGGQRTTANPTVTSTDPFTTLSGRGVFNFPGVDRGLDDVADGASRTVMLSEVIAGAALGDYRGRWWVESGVQYSHWGTPNNPSPDYHHLPRASRPADGPKRHLVPIEFWPGGRPANLTSARSMHPGVVIATWVDGSTRTVRDDIALEVWRALGSIDGGDGAVAE